MTSKPYRFGFLVGRFQTPHLGHLEMIDRALSLCARVGVLIGSAQESFTSKNPFSYEKREELLRLIYGPAIDIAPLKDIGVGNNCAWGEYVLQSASELFGEAPDLFISGKEGRRQTWFDCAAGEALAELYVPKTIDISASKMREFLLANDSARWKRYTDKRLWPQFEPLRALAQKARDNNQTDSM